MYWKKKKSSGLIRMQRWKEKRKILQRSLLCSYAKEGRRSECDLSTLLNQQNPVEASRGRCGFVFCVKVRKLEVYKHSVFIVFPEDETFISERGFFFPFLCCKKFSFTDYFRFVVFCNFYVSKACFCSRTGRRDHIAAAIKVSRGKLT